MNLFLSFFRMVISVTRLFLPDLERFFLHMTYEEYGNKINSVKILRSYFDGNWSFGNRIGVCLKY